MPIEFINPLTDERYKLFVASHPDATVFHSKAWIRVLNKTYGFRPGCVALVNNTKITAVLPYMETCGITGKPRGVSLPFSDFCEPLVSEESNFDSIINALVENAQKRKWKYIDLRGGVCFIPESVPHVSIITHTISLKEKEDHLFTSLRKSVQRNIVKAEKAGLSISFDISDKAIKEFYRLNCLTRREHGLPPQPRSFFNCLRENFLEHNCGFVASVHLNGKTIASAIFLMFNNKAYFKYGASDNRFLNLRPNDFLMWKCIQECRQRANTTLNLGRTELPHTGLLQFKRGWGGEETYLKYFRLITVKGKKRFTTPPPNHTIFSIIAARLPLVVLKGIGMATYRYAG